VYFACKDLFANIEGTINNYNSKHIITASISVYAPFTNKKFVHKQPRHIKS